MRQREIELAQQGFKLRLAENEAWPSITVAPQFEQEKAGRETESIAGIGVSVPLPLCNRNQGGVQTANARLLQAETSLKVMLRVKSGSWPGNKVVFSDLRHAANDAVQVADCFRLHAGTLYRQVIARTLLDRAATAGAVQQGLREIAQQATPVDVVLVYFSGHGAIDPGSGFYLATHDTEPAAVETSALTEKKLGSLLAAISGRPVLVLDACHSGAIARGGASTPPITSPRDLQSLGSRLSADNQEVVVFSSSSEAEVSLEHLELGGVFTLAFCEGIMGHGASTVPGRVERMVTCSGMQRWLAQRVPELLAIAAGNLPDAPPPEPEDAPAGEAGPPPVQTPIASLPRGVPDFPLAAIDGPKPPIATAGQPQKVRVEPGPTPTAVLEQLLAGSSGDGAVLDPRVESSFAEEVNFHGEKIPWDDISHLLSGSLSAFASRTFTLMGVDAETVLPDGRVTLRGQVKVSTRTHKEGAATTETMHPLEAVLARIGGRWKIVALPTSPFSTTDPPSP